MAPQGNACTLGEHTRVGREQAGGGEEGEFDNEASPSAHLSRR